MDLCKDDISKTLMPSTERSHESMQSQVYAVMSLCSNESMLVGWKNILADMVSRVS